VSTDNGRGFVKFDQSRKSGAREYAFRKDRQEARRNARRRILTGFPWEGRFRTWSDVQAYIGQTRGIECLLCGKVYRTVSNHLRVHGVTDSEYRERFGIPENVGLVCRDSAERYGIPARERMKHLPESAKKAQAELMRAISPSPRHQKTMRKAEASLKNLTHAMAVVLGRLESSGKLRPAVQWFCKNCGADLGMSRSPRRYCDMQCRDLAWRAEPLCKRGHALDADNTVWHDGRRSCRKCRAMNAKDYKLRKRAAA